MFLVVDADRRIATFEDRPTCAAHSMDTDWYAVDRDGHVALLESGEEGSVPYVAHRQYWSELFDDLVVARIAASSPAEPFAERAALLRRLASTTEPVEAQLVTAVLAGDEPSRVVYADWLEQQGRSRCDPAGGGDAWPLRQRCVFSVGRELRTIDPDALPAQWDGVVRFANREYLEMFQSEVYHQEWRELDARLGMPDAVAIKDVLRYAFDDYWSAGAIETAYLIEHPVEPQFVGLYEYACRFSGPYARRAVPTEPLLVDQLPEPLRGRLASLALARLSFATSDELDPETFADCQRWRE
jgi:hypothetical protein